MKTIVKTKLKEPKREYKRELTPAEKQVFEKRSLEISNAIKEMPEPEKANICIEEYTKYFDFYNMFGDCGVYGIVKVLSQPTRRYFLFKKSQYYNFTNPFLSDIGEMIVEITKIFEDSDPNFYLAYGDASKGKQQQIKEFKITLREFLERKVDRASAFVNDSSTNSRFVVENQDRCFNRFQNARFLSAQGKKELPKVTTDKDFPTITKIIFNVCDSNKEHYKWFIDWLAYKFQNPQKRFSTNIIFCGGQGTGKGMLTKIILPYIWGCTCGITTKQGLTTEFNASLVANKYLMIADEVFDASDSFKMRNIMKPYETEPKVLINDKYEKPYLAASRVSFIYTSNMPIPLALDKDNRRHAVFKTHTLIKSILSDEELDDFHETDPAKHSARFIKEITAFMGYLNTIALNPDVVDVPIDTPAKRSLITLSRSDTDIDIEQAYINIYSWGHGNGWHQHKGGYYVLASALCNEHARINPKNAKSQMRFNELVLHYYRDAKQN